MRTHAELADLDVGQLVESYVFDQPGVIHLVRLIGDHSRATRGEEQRENAVERADIINHQAIQRQIAPKHFFLVCAPRESHAGIQPSPPLRFIPRIKPCRTV